jgi:hypothetical protein
VASGNNHAGEPKVVGAGHETLGLVSRRSSDGNIIIGRDYDGADRVVVLALYEGEGKLNLRRASHGGEWKLRECRPTML